MIIIVTKKNIKKILLYSLLLFLFSVIVYSVPNPGHLLSEIQGYFPGDANLEESIPKFQGLINSCPSGEIMTGINTDGTVDCDTLIERQKWAPPSSITPTTNTFDGDFGGYDDMKDKCNGFGDHVCDSTELVAWMQSGGGNKNGWYNAGIRADGYTVADDFITFSECQGWRYNNPTPHTANFWNGAYPDKATCNQQKRVLCCTT